MAVTSKKAIKVADKGKLKVLESERRARKKIFIFISLFALYMIVFYFIWLSEFFNSKVNPGIDSAYAIIGSLILNIFGQGTSQFGASVSSPFFAIVINRGCDAVEATALFVSALLAFPGKWRKKIIGLMKGVAILFILNIIRIVSLFLIGRYYPGYFDYFHVEVWQVIFIIIAFGLFVSWVKSQTLKTVEIEK